MTGSGSWLARHRVTARLLYALAAAGFVVAALEGLLRVTVAWDPGYYVAFGAPEAGTTLHYRYGDIPINRHGFPDDEWGEVPTRPRVGYVGDSVCFGLGAGYGHRVSELLEQRLPGYEHLNFGKPGWLLSAKTAPQVAGWADEFVLAHVVYLMNLNDIGVDLSPEQRRRVEGWPWLPGLKARADALRGRSYLYTMLRTLVKTRYVRAGFRGDGQPAYELSPLRYLDVLSATAGRIRALNDDLARRGVGLTLVLLPYEMQISREAERRYRELGVAWDEESFIDRGPQRVLERRLRGVRVLDAYWAFVDPADIEGSRSRNAVGAYFVYDRGDRIDFNHPNRAGHRRLADFLAGEGLGIE